MASRIEWQKELKTYLPWTASPLIMNAPMGGCAWAPLATAVSQAGGLGFIGSLHEMSQLRTQLTQARDTFKASSTDSIATSPTLPLGVGFLVFLCKLEEVVPVVADFKPAVVWLFAAKGLDDYQVWAEKLREASPQTKVWVQVGNVEAAVRVARTAKPDALCLQGADAGGHGFEAGAGIISLLPEATDTLRREGLGHIVLVASGGIADGRGVAAALALGAAGAVMGTRFLASKEVTVHPIWQEAILEAEDGGQATRRSRIFDQLRGPSIWPEAYDGRSLVMKSFTEYAQGKSLEEIQRLHNEAVNGEDKGFATGGNGRAAIWAGAGVGIVKEVEAAADIVNNVRKETRAIMIGLGNL